jgi:hypothetical protein
MYAWESNRKFIGSHGNVKFLNNLCRVHKYALSANIVCCSVCSCCYSNNRNEGYLPVATTSSKMMTTDGKNLCDDSIYYWKVLSYKLCTSPLPLWNLNDNLERLPRAYICIVALPCMEMHNSAPQKHLRSIYGTC